MDKTLDTMDNELI